MKKLCLLLLFLVLPAGWWTSRAQRQGIRVSPSNVNINANGATVVQLAFGPLSANQKPAEGCWCGELVSAAPDAGMKCNPATLWACTPARFDLSTRSANSGFTDIMTIPNSVMRRAYQAAENGATSSYFYVRRFLTAGGRDEYVPVTCRLGSGGATTPFALTDVKLSFSSQQPVQMIKIGDKLPPLQAEIAYNGTGRLKGRWEVVKPGDKLPEPRDLMTEATLPLEERGTQQRYFQVSTFNVLLQPTGKFILPGPDVRRFPTAVAGPYLVLLRIEATDDQEGDANLLNVGGPGIVHNGAAAGFPLPALRYFVGGSSAPGALTLLLPTADAVLPPAQPLDFRWSAIATAALYRLEIEDLAAKPFLSALLTPGTTAYHAPPWLKDKAGNLPLRWRVIALDTTGKPLVETAWQGLRLQPNVQRPSPTNTKPAQ